MEFEYSAESLPGGVQVCITKEHRFGTDAFLLSHFAGVRKTETAVDLGSGCGIIAALWFTRGNAPRLAYAVEVQELAAKQLCKTIQLSALEDKIIPIHADLRCLQDKLPCDFAHVVTCNPPYKTGGTGILSEASSDKIARHETMCTIGDVCKSAASLLKFGGRLCVCQRPERLCDVMEAMRQNGIEPKRLRFVQKYGHTAPWLFLLEGRRGGRPFLRVEAPLIMEREEGGFTDEVLRIYGKIE